LEVAVPHLKITVPASALIFWGRERVLAELAKRLKHYEDEIKAKGFRENPSRLEKHARWWFEYYVHGKTFDQIAAMETYIGGPIPYAANVGAAVRRFSKLISIDPKSLK